jgi:hypothetical protein
LHKWKIYYSDGVVVSPDTTWEDCPDDDIQAVIVYYDKPYELDGILYHRRNILQGFDYYFSDGSEIFCNNDTLEVNQRRYPGYHFKRGKWIANERFDELHKQVMGDLLRYGNNIHT